MKKNYEKNYQILDLNSRVIEKRNVWISHVQRIETSILPHIFRHYRPLGKISVWGPRKRFTDDL